MRFIGIFERQTPPNDIDGTGGDWTELFKEWVTPRPLTARELVNAAQIQSQASTSAELEWSNTAGQLRSKDRFKIALPTPVKPDAPDDEANFRIFHLESVINPNEANRKLQLMCIERT